MDLPSDTLGKAAYSWSVQKETLSVGSTAVAL